MKFTPIKSRRTSHQIIDQIREQVLEGSLAPGDKLLNERDLSALLNVSRTTLREATSALEVIGLLDVRPGEGTFIRESAADDLIAPLSLMLMLERNMPEVWAVRKFLEATCARIAAEMYTEEDEKILDGPLQQMERDIAQKREARSADISFHKGIAELTRNRLLGRLMTTIGDVVRQSFNKSWPERFSTPEGAAEILREHQEIADAIRRKDPVDAEKATIYHLNRVEKYLFPI